jgi:hypothetical protein
MTKHQTPRKTQQTKTNIESLRNGGLSRVSGSGNTHPTSDGYFPGNNPFWFVSQRHEGRK